MTELKLPFNLEAEQALLGAVLVNNEAFYRIFDTVGADDFYEPLHGMIFEAIAKMIGAGKAATVITIKGYLPETVADIPISQYLAGLYANVTTVINAPDFAEAVRDASIRRRLIEISEQMGADALEQDMDKAPKQLIEDAEKALFELAEVKSTRSRVHSFTDAVSSAMENAAAAYSRDGGLSGMPTGLIDLDRLMGGLQSSDLIILAARPGMGKTALATNIAFHAATHDKNVLFFSLEMSAEQLATRIISEQSGVPSSMIRRGDIHESQFNTLADTARAVSRSPLFIDDTGGSTIAHLSATARRIKRQKGIDLIVVDYIQLLSGGARYSGNRVQEVTEISNKLKTLAKELSVPVLALSQLSRQVESRDDKRPQLSDLRESGSIEQDADVVMFLYREEYYLRSKEPQEGTASHMQWQNDMEAATGRAECIIAKQRHGATGKVDLAFEAKFTRFGNLAKPEYMAERVA